MLNNSLKLLRVDKVYGKSLRNTTISDDKLNMFLCAIGLNKSHNTAKAGQISGYSSSNIPRFQISRLCFSCLQLLCQTAVESNATKISFNYTTARFVIDNKF